jgi:hypothetical protein
VICSHMKKLSGLNIKPEGEKGNVHVGAGLSIV